MNAVLARLVLVGVVGVMGVGACGSKAAAPPPISGSRVAEAPSNDDTAGGPYDYRTWTAKLGDPDESDRAVTELETLGNPGAIVALGEAWREQGRPARMLQVMISLSRPLTPQEAMATFMTDYEKTGRPASWSVSMPFLVEALVKVDMANPRSVDSAIKAADAIGESKDPSGLEALIKVALTPPNKKLIAAQVACIRSIGAFLRAKPLAGKALVELVERIPPPHPRMAGREAEERFGLHLAVTGAAVNALATWRSPAPAKPLVLAMYRVPELFMQIRRALVASGPAVKDELRAILRDEHEAVKKLFADDKLDRYCGDDGKTKCVPVSAKDFYPAVVLGDFYDPASVPDLLAALERKPHPVYYMEDTPSPNTQHNGIFDALRKIGAPGAAVKVRAIWQDPKRDLWTRVLAIGAYPFVARDEVGVAELGAIAADNAADDSLRQEAATAFARMSTSTKSIEILTRLADRYFKASADKKKEAEGKPRRDADAADKVFEAKKAKFDAAKAALVAKTNDSSSAEEIRKATAALRALEDDFKAAKKKHREAVGPFKQADSAAKAYKGYARMFQTHIARIEIAIRCKQDLACFADSLKLVPEDSAKNASAYIKDIADWTRDEKLGLLEANIERAMLELGKWGAQAEPFTEKLLAAVKSDNRLTRQSILLALPKIAKTPCSSCVVALDAAIKAGEGKTTLGDLNLETTILRNYFASAGMIP